MVSLKTGKYNEKINTVKKISKGVVLEYFILNLRLKSTLLL